MHAYYDYRTLVISHNFAVLLLAGSYHSNRSGKQLTQIWNEALAWLRFSIHDPWNVAAVYDSQFTPDSFKRLFYTRHSYLSPDPNPPQSHVVRSPDTCAVIRVLHPRNPHSLFTIDTGPLSAGYWFEETRWLRHEWEILYQERWDSVWGTSC